MTCQFVPLTTHDRPPILQHLLHLGVADRVLRFGTAAQDNAIVDYCGRWNFARDVVEGAWRDGRLVGLIHLPVYEEGDDLVGELGSRSTPNRVSAASRRGSRRARWSAGAPAVWRGSTSTSWCATGR
jgi:hypothetical protein